jgi:hypothetical protein
VIWTDSNIDAWWHSPQVMGVMWAVITFLGGAVKWYHKQWKEDHDLLYTLKKKVDDLDNGTTFTELRTKMNDMHNWWMDRIQRR